MSNSSEVKPFLKTASPNDMSDEEDVGMLKDYDKEYQETSAKISRAISQMQGKKGSKLESLVTDIKIDIKSCERCVKSMEFECKNLTISKSKWKDTINRYKQDLKSLKKDYSRDLEVAQRSELFNGKDPQNFTEDDVRLSTTLETEKNNTVILDEARSMLHGTEQEAIEIGDELVRQGDKTRGMLNKLKDGNHILGRVGRSISRMSRRQAMMSVMWCCVILIILGVIGLILYLKLK